MPSTSCQKIMKEVQNIVPVMIGQILRSSGNFKAWSIPVNNIIIVGILRSINESTTKITYDIEDETGTITVVSWLGIKKRTGEPPLKINNYIKIFGRLWNKNGTKQIVVMRIQNLKDLNELTNHLLEITYVTLNERRLCNREITGDLPFNMDDSSRVAQNNSSINLDQATIKYNICQ